MKAHPERTKEIAFRCTIRRMGISPERFYEMVEEQGGVCAICKQPELRGRLRIDHDHACCSGRGRSCGKCIRGLLCISCNASLGGFRDDPDILRAAIVYLDAA